MNLYRILAQASIASKLWTSEALIEARSEDIALIVFWLQHPGWEITDFEVLGRIPNYYQEHYPEEEDEEEVTAMAA